MGLFELVSKGTPLEIQAAIDQGEDVNAQDERGRTVLMYAAESSQNPEVITTLLKAGPDIKAQDKAGLTALMWSAEYNLNPEVVTTLLKAGSDGKAKDSEGKTAVDCAKGNAKLRGTNAYRKLREVSIVSCNDAPCSLLEGR